MVSFKTLLLVYLFVKSLMAYDMGPDFFSKTRVLFLLYEWESQPLAFFLEAIRVSSYIPFKRYYSVRPGTWILPDLI